MDTIKLNPGVALSNLLDGMKLECEGCTYMLSENGELCQIARKTQNNIESLVYLNTGISLKNFINMISDMSEADVIKNMKIC